MYLSKTFEKIKVKHIKNEILNKLMTNRKLNIWDYLFYLSLIVLTIWLILKSIGVINTPFWLEYGVPIVTIVITSLTFYKNILDSIGKLAINLATLNTKFSHLDSKVDNMNTKLNKVYIDVEFLKRK